MPRADRVYWLHALSPLHIGAGRGEGYIDLPLAREKATNLPYVPGSSVKGVFADACGATEAVRKTPGVVRAAFGAADATEDQKSLANAGALVLTDARLVCLPVRSLYGTFAWCTSRFVLARLRRDLDAAGLALGPAPPSVVGQVTAHVAPGSVLAHGGKVYVEDLDATEVRSDEAEAVGKQLAAWLFPTANDPWQAEFVARFVVLPDDLFTFLAESATEVQPHVRIDAEAKRVANGALWYEESLPAEAVLAGLVWCDKVNGVAGVTKEQVLGLCANKDGTELHAVQLGGKATVGKGRTRLLFTRGGGV